MKLLHPRPNEWVDYNNLPGIPDRLNLDTGFLFISMAEDNGNGYVCFTNQEKDNIWIEKFSRFQAAGQFSFEMLNKIEDENEFAAAHGFFIEQGILDAGQQSKSNTN